ncbi:hypothetical protein K6V90_25030 [Cupriavidus pauculus]|uniref:hypothetical protein n=1 Tax=Cupriavidus pauculus TaxID=82633 RepID=UPI001C93448E|nr:hypothetical protein [Cupriavidus pauculus]MBY4733807.1 hypothetical protein [Cupriavidus pauculus]
MKTMTIAEFMLETARGAQKQRILPEKVANEVRSQLAQRVEPKIEEIRSEQRKAFEDSKTVVLF